MPGVPLSGRMVKCFVSRTFSLQYFDLCVSICVLIPADTSECERIFSLMIERGPQDRFERNLMGQQNLKNLMLWHIMGYKTDAEGNKVKMPCCDVPVMAILKEFRERWQAHADVRPIVPLSLQPTITRSTVCDLLLVTCR